MLRIDGLKWAVTRYQNPLARHGYGRMTFVRKQRGHF